MKTKSDETLRDLVEEYYESLTNNINKPKDENIDIVEYSKKQLEKTIEKAEALGFSESQIRESLFF